jgi:ribosomal protein S18 acetylase RimI-like enzyme
MDEVSYEEYRHDSTDVTDEDLTGFCEGWPSKPSPSVLLAVLTGSHCSFMARTGDGRVIGVVSAISDGVLSASIPLLEVVPESRGRGIGTRLMRLVLERLEGFYMGGSVMRRGSGALLPPLRDARDEGDEHPPPSRDL